MKHFSSLHRMQDLFMWLAGNVAGDCSVIVDLPVGPAVYVCSGSGSLWQRVYGPVAAAGEDQTPCAMCGEPYSVHRPPSGNSAPFCTSRQSRPGDTFIRGER